MFVEQPILAYRVWWKDGLDLVSVCCLKGKKYGEYTLTPSNYRWTKGENIATCHHYKQHNPPVTSCHCGIWGLSLNQIYDWIGISQHIPDHPPYLGNWILGGIYNSKLVVGTIWMGGNVIIGDESTKSSVAQIAHVFNAPDIAEYYGVESVLPPEKLLPCYHVNVVR